MRMNTAVAYPPVRTHQGAPVVRLTSEQQLRRAVATCMLWESQFYEDGVTIADRIANLVPQCRPEFVAACAFEARTKMKLRHVPLLLVIEMTKHTTHRHLVAPLLRHVIQRADELTEYVALYFGGHDRKVHGHKLSAASKRGLAAAFQKFDEYQLAKYNRDNGVKLRDVMLLVRPKPKDQPQADLWKRLLDGKLATPDTWEVQLSAGADKAETFKRLMDQKQLGALAFLRNLRNMKDAGVSAPRVAQYGTEVNIDRVLPFRFIAAARAVPAWENLIEPMMLRALQGREKLPGKTVLLVDVSGSMDSRVSAKADITRLDAACGVAILLRELCDDIDVFAFHDRVEQIAPRRGFALRDAIGKTRGGTYLGKAVEAVRYIERERIIVLTDEQSADPVGAPGSKGYMINVASAQNGVGYGPWHRINGWSESVIDYVQEFERSSGT